MAGNVITQGAHPVSTFLTVADLHQYGTFGGLERCFAREHLFVPSQQEAQQRADRFFQYLRRDLVIKDGAEPFLQRFFNRILTLPDSQGNNPIHIEMSRAFFKPHGYLFRLFSHESWGKWTEQRTALGRVAFQLRDYIDGQSTENAFMGSLDADLLRQANEEAATLLTHLDHPNTMRPSTTLFKSSCMYGFLGGAIGSLVTNSPVPLLIGLRECVPWASAQQPLGNEFRVNTNTTGNQDNPCVAGFSNGDFIVVWAGQDGDGYGIFAQLFDGGGSPIGNEFPVNTYFSGNQINPSCTGFPNGNFVIIWESDGQDGDLNGVYGRLFNGTGTKIGPEFLVNTYTTNSQRRPSTASFPNGNFVVTWQSYGQEGKFEEIYAQLFYGNGSKIGDEFRVNTYTTNEQQLSIVTSLPNGNFVVVWQSNGPDGNRYGVFGQLFDGNGSPIGNEFQANTYTQDQQWLPYIGSIRNGNFVIVWQSNRQDGDLFGIFGQLFNENASITGNEFPINAYKVNEQGRAIVKGLNNGNFVVTWQSYDQDGNLFGIFGQLFDGSASKLENEFQVNTYITNEQKEPSVASLGNNDFVVIWQSDLQDGSGFGIYGQIFHDNTSRTLSMSTTSSFTTSTTTQAPTSTTTPPVPTSSTTPSVPSTTTSVPTSSIDQSTSATVGSTATSSRMKSSSSFSSVVAIPSSSSNPISPSKADQEKSKNWGLVIVVSLVSCISVAICVAIIGFIILRRRKKEGGSEVELAATTEQSSNSGGTKYAPVHEETPLEVDGEIVGEDNTHSQRDDSHQTNGRTSGKGDDPNYQNLSDCSPQANGRTSGNGEEPNYQNLSACKTQANGSSSEAEPEYQPLSAFLEQE